MPFGTGAGSFSATTPIAILCATVIGEALRADPGLDPLTVAATLSVLVGIMFVMARVLRHPFRGRPPVMIDVEADGKHYQEMHVDGGTMAQVFAYPAVLRAKNMADATGTSRVPGPAPGSGLGLLQNRQDRAVAVS